MTEYEIKESKEWLQDFIRMFGCNFDDSETRIFNKIVTYLEELKQYKAIGTVEELKDLKEKNVAKKVIVKKSETIELDVCDEKGYVHLCPNCNDYIICADMKHCWNCGQALET